MYPQNFVTQKGQRAPGRHRIRSIARQHETKTRIVDGVLDCLQFTR